MLGPDLCRKNKDAYSICQNVKYIHNKHNYTNEQFWSYLWFLMSKINIALTLY